MLWSGIKDAGTLCGSQ